MWLVGILFMPIIFAIMFLLVQTKAPNAAGQGRRKKDEQHET
jgi:hypothetical protein